MQEMDRGITPLLFTTSASGGGGGGSLLTPRTPVTPPARSGDGGDISAASWGKEKKENNELKLWHYNSCERGLSIPTLFNRM